MRENERKRREIKIKKSSARADPRSFLTLALVALKPVSLKRRRNGPTSAATGTVEYQQKPPQQPLAEDQLPVSFMNLNASRSGAP